MGVAGRRWQAAGAKGAVQRVPPAHGRQRAAPHRATRRLAAGAAGVLCWVLCPGGTQELGWGLGWVRQGCNARRADKQDRGCGGSTKVAGRVCNVQQQDSKSRACGWRA